MILVRFEFEVPVNRLLQNRIGTSNSPHELRRPDPAGHHRELEG
jgi:hypothetical protein